MTLKTFALAVVASGFATAVQADIVVDDFSVPQMFTVDDATETAPEVTGGLGVLIGGARDLQIQANGGSVMAEAVGATFTISNDIGVTSVSTLTYDGIGTGAGAAGLGGIDLTDGGILDSFIVEVSSNDSAVDFTFAVESASGTSELSLGLSGFDAFIREGSFPNNGPVEFAFDFANFVATSGSGADFTEAEQIAFSVASTGSANDTSFEILSIQDRIPSAVPVPASLALLMSGLVGFGFLRARRVA